jgi:phage antirepressor YoqD-like protein
MNAMQLSFNSEEKTMSSREIAEYAVKLHKDVLEAIRTMEPAWVKVTGRKFPLSEYTDPTGRKLPMYELTKTECLYVATKFNDEARAKLIIRWEELENSKPKLPSTKELAMMVIRAEEEKERLQIQTQKQQDVIKAMVPKVQYHDEVLQSPNVFPITVIAKELGMSGQALNEKLNKMRIIYRSGKSWVLFHKYQNLGLTKTKTYTNTDEEGKTVTAIHTYWTQRGRAFIHDQIKRKDSVLDLGLQ